MQQASWTAPIKIKLNWDNSIQQLSEDFNYLESLDLPEALLDKVFNIVESLREGRGFKIDGLPTTLADKSNLSLSLQFLEPYQDFFAAVRARNRDGLIKILEHWQVPSV